MGKYFIKETWNKKIKLKSKHECLTQCHIRLFLISFLIAPLVFIIISSLNDGISHHPGDEVLQMKVCSEYHLTSPKGDQNHGVPMPKDLPPALHDLLAPGLCVWLECLGQARMWCYPGSPARTPSARVGHTFMSLFGEGSSYGITGIKESWTGLG